MRIQEAIHFPLVTHTNMAIARQVFLREMRERKMRELTNLRFPASATTNSKIVYSERESKSMSETSYEPYVIHRTRDYTLLKPHPENRPVDPDEVDRLAAEMRINNELPSSPIVTNENLVVMEGHTRHAAAEKAKVEISFLIIPGMTLQRAIKKDSLTKNWSNKNHLDRYANVGKLGYLLIQNFWKEYNWLTFSNLVRLCSSKGYRKTEFPHGIYNADRIAFAKVVCDMALDFKPYFKYYHMKTFLDTMAQLANRDNYNHQRMIRKVKFQAHKLERQSTVPQYLNILTEIYNSHENERNHEYFFQKKNFTLNRK